MDLAEIHAIKKSSKGSSKGMVKAPPKNSRRALPTYKQAIREVGGGVGERTYRGDVNSTVDGPEIARRPEFRVIGV